MNVKEIFYSQVDEALIKIFDDKTSAEQEVLADTVVCMVVQLDALRGKAIKDEDRE